MSKAFCRCCGDDIAQKRWALGFKFCMPCGEELAKKRKHTIVPMHKSNYIVVTDLNLLTGVNTKGGIVK
jgi:ribosomal protein L37AE/L43A